MSLQIRPPVVPDDEYRNALLPITPPSEEALRKNEMAVLTLRGLAEDVISGLTWEDLANSIRCSRHHRGSRA